MARTVTGVFICLYRLAETAQQMYGQPSYTIGYEYDPDTVTLTSAGG